MNKKVRLTNEEAIALGLKLNKIPPLRNKAHYSLTPEQQELLKEIQHSGVAKHAKERGIDFNAITEYWDKTKEYSLRVRPEVVQLRDICSELIDEMKDYAPLYKTIQHSPCNDPHLLIIDPADIHIGKLATPFETGEEYNSEIAIQRVREGVEGILQKSSGFDIEQIVLVIGNDILHIDTPKRTTTSGTPQDTDGMWYDNFLKAKSIYVEIIERLMQKANVHIIFNPSNHDYMTGFFLADTIGVWFRNCENVTFDISISHRKYYTYGLNLIGTTHGDGAKIQDLPLLMANESKQWSDTKYRYVYIHHFHHKLSKEYQGVTVEALRSPSGTDSWHHRNGYQHSVKAIEGYLHHKAHGQIARFTHYF
jgi:hypothetical protein